MAACGTVPMNLRSKLLPALSFAVSVALTSCGTTTGHAPISGAALNGNWNITGNRQLKQYPLLSTTLTVAGNQITGQGDMFIECGNGIGGGGTVSFTGQIAANGTFHLTQPPLPIQSPPSSFQVTIDGSLPSAGSTTWSGTYTITASIGPTCQNLNQAGSFKATAFQPIHGTYAGPIGGIALGSAASMSTQISEAAPITLNHANGTTSTLYPLSATISISGSPCFKSGTTGGNTFPNEVSGDLVILDFTMDDGSQLHMDTWMTDTSETTLEPVSLVVSGGQCTNKAGSSVLTAQ